MEEGIEKLEQFRFYVVLHCLSKFMGERSIYAIYHLLQGKKSSQTIQDAKLFKLDCFFQAMQHLSKNDIDDIIYDLEASSYINMTNKDTYILTEKGYFYLEKLLEKYPIPNYLNGWYYHKKALVFWQRFSLLVQTLSCLIYEHSSFIPVINDDAAQHWIKRYVKQVNNRIDYANQLFSECQNVLKLLPKLHAEIFVLHLSGFHRVGYTSEQVGRLLQLDKEYAFILFQSVLHFFIRHIEANSADFYCLSSFLEQDQRTATLTISSQRTYHLLKQHHSITEIALIRNLKESTIEDHIVEIASEIADFNIDPFVSKELQEKITNIVLSLRTKRLKSIRDTLNETVSYFQIRLVLGRMEE